MNNGLQIPQIGYGTYLVQDAEIIYQSIQIGYRHLDTAEFYRNEQLVGEACRKAMKDLNLQRKDLFVTTKVPPYYLGTEKSTQCIENSLKLLNIDYIDLALIHFPGQGSSSKNKEYRKQTWQILEYYVNQGYIKSIGVSNFTVKHIQQLLQFAKIKPVINQIQLHPMKIEHDIIDFCQKNNILIEAYSPFAKWNQTLIQNQILQRIAKEHNSNVAQIIMAFLAQKGYVVIPKSSNYDRIINNIAFNHLNLTKENIRNIDQMGEGRKVSVCWDPENID